MKQLMLFSVLTLIPTVVIPMTDDKALEAERLGNFNKALSSAKTALNNLPAGKLEASRAMRQLSRALWLISTEEERKHLADNDCPGAVCALGEHPAATARASRQLTEKRMPASKPKKVTEKKVVAAKQGTAQSKARVGKQVDTKATKKAEIKANKQTGSDTKKAAVKTSEKVTATKIDPKTKKAAISKQKESANGRTLNAGRIQS